MPAITRTPVSGEALERGCPAAATTIRDPIGTAVPRIASQLLAASRA